MPRITIRFDGPLIDRLLERAGALRIPPSTYIRDLVARDLGADPGGYHGRFDELHATSIQTLSILASYVGRQAPDALALGMDDARDLLRDRGLLDPEADR